VPRGRKGESLPTTTHRTRATPPPSPLTPLATPETNANQQGWSGPLKAAVTSGSLCAVGDVLAQSIAGWYASRGQQLPAAAATQKKGSKASAAAPSSSSSNSYEACRTLRMAGFGLLFYGPYQYYWYSLLEHLMPRRTVPNFVAKVAANQLLLAPVTLTVAFAWHLAFSKASGGGGNGGGGKNGGAKGAAKGGKTSAAASSSSGGGLLASPAFLGGRLAPLPEKMRADFVPALLTGWKFWVPAASVNFCAVPLRHQVLYMSCCGVLWTAYLSHASGTKLSPDGGKVASGGGGKRR